MNIELLYTEECPFYETAKKRIEQALRELDISETINLVKISSQDDVISKQFIGSPSVRIQDVDVDPTSRKSTSYSLSCRNYQTSEGFVGWPDVGMIKKTIESKKVK